MQLIQDISKVIAENYQGICRSKYRDLLDYFIKKIAKALPQ